jgi:membrane protease YdiL (CAAX protease family)
MKELPAGPPPGGLRHYLAVTRGPWYGFVCALPLLLTYQVLIWALHPNVINGGDAILRSVLLPLFQLVGWRSRESAFLVLLAASGVICWLGHRAAYGREGGLRGGYLAAMLAESGVYAVFFGTVVNAILRAVLPTGLQIGAAHGSPILSVTLALGAGIYEELVFRVLLMGGLALLFNRGLRLGLTASWVTAALLSSVVFSLFHYLGSAGDTFTLASFLFRFVSGAVLAALYGLRGFGVAVWTHALYDVLVMLLGG